MSYALVITDAATEDLHRIVDSLKSSHRRDAIEAVDIATQRLAANPRFGQSTYLGRRAFHFDFQSGDSHYHLGCAFEISPDEETIVITHIFRLPL